MIMFDSYMWVWVIGFSVCGIAGLFTVFSAVRHLRKQREVNSYRIEREAFERDSLEVSKEQLVGGVSEAMADDRGRIALFAEHALPEPTL